MFVGEYVCVPLNLSVPISIVGLLHSLVPVRAVVPVYYVLAFNDKLHTRRRLQGARGRMHAHSRRSIKFNDISILVRILVAYVCKCERKRSSSCVRKCACGSVWVNMCVVVVYVCVFKCVCVSVCVIVRVLVSKCVRALV